MAVKTVEIDNLINGQLYGFRMFPRNLKGQYQTRDDRGTATATPVAFQLPTYTGNHAIFGDINEGRIEMYTSGTLTLSAGTYDLFAVGGGGSGYDGGGGGGYTSTLKQAKINYLNNINVNIGSGGEQKLAGGNTSIGNVLTVLGGKSGSHSEAASGGNGGSGGGGWCYDTGYATGGSDGSNGKNGYKGSKGGIGQNSTTKAFGETTNTLYSGGGGGSASSTGGAGGGGNGGGGGWANTGKNGTSGTPNTGGGGGGADDRYHLQGTGGSGIAIVRWKRN